MTSRQYHQLDNIDTLGVRQWTPQRVRDAQIGVAYAAMTEFPDDPVGATREMLQMLGLFRHTGLENFSSAEK